MHPLLAPIPVLVALAASPFTDREALAMGTRLVLHLEGDGAQGAGEAALVEIQRIETACSTWRPDSAWSRLNAARGADCRLDPEWMSLLAQAKGWGLRTEGAFDPVLMSLVRAWGLREGGLRPDHAALEAARRASGGALLQLDAATNQAHLGHPAAGIEEGAFLKGYALDRARRVSQPQAPHGWLDFGGQILAWGRAIPLEIAHPLHRDRPSVRLVLADASLSTSGCSERGRHILDPRTGRPCAAWGSVSVVAASAFEADVLSTALYVMGPRRGLAWAARHEVAALFLFNDGGARMSPRFAVLRPVLIP